jgi:hypothetical protein
MECRFAGDPRAGREELLKSSPFFTVIEGARIDDLKYLKDHGIDRNQVSQQLSRIFSQMVYLNGYFHADPHHVCIPTQHNRFELFTN